MENKIENKIIQDNLTSISQNIKICRLDIRELQDKILKLDKNRPSVMDYLRNYNEEIHLIRKEIDIYLKILNEYKI